MKKIFAAIMALCLMLTTAAALAETDIVEIKWADHEADAAQIEGQFAAVAQTGLQMFIPAEFKDSAPDQETLDAGIFMVLTSDQEPKAIVNAQIQDMDIAVFTSALEQQGVTVRTASINGLPAIMFSAKTADVLTACFAFGTVQNTTMLFSFSNADQEPYTSLYRIMASSIQAAE